MKIPVSAAKMLAQKFKLSQLILFGWDGKQTHVVTYGESIEDCAQAAEGANRIKDNWGWPESTLVEPPRVRTLQKKLATALNEIQELRNKLNGTAQLVVLQPDAGWPFPVPRGNND